jgi:hypothetical protein
MQPFLAAGAVLGIVSAGFFAVQIAKRFMRSRKADLEFKFRTGQITHEEMRVLEKLRR